MNTTACLKRLCAWCANRRWKIDFETKARRPRPFQFRLFAIFLALALYFQHSANAQAVVIGVNVINPYQLRHAPPRP